MHLKKNMKTITPYNRSTQAVLYYCEAYQNNVNTPSVCTSFRLFESLETCIHLFDQGRCFSVHNYGCQCSNKL